MGSWSLAAGPGGGSQLGDPLLIALVAGGGFSFQLGLGLLQPGQPLRSTGQRPRQRITAADAALAILGLIRLGGLGEQVGDSGLEVGVGAVSRCRSVGLDLGPVERDQPQAYHPGRTIPAAAHSFNN
jgi:hypothetical protein